MNNDRMDELQVLFSEMRKLQRPKLKQVLKQGCIALLVLSIIAVGAVGLVRAHKRHVGKEFLETLYTVTEADLTDPQPRIERLYALADEALVEELLRSERIPAVYFYENGIPLTMSFTADRAAAFEKCFPKPGVIAFPGSVTLHKGMVTRASAPVPAFYLFVEDGNIEDLLAPGFDWKRLARAEWE